MPEFTPSTEQLPLSPKLYVEPLLAYEQKFVLDVELPVQVPPRIRSRLAIMGPT